MILTDAENTVIELIKETAENLHYHGKMLNERYLHHYFSYKLQEKLTAIDITSQASIKIHPEWPTSKKSTKINYGKYKKINKRYIPHKNGTAGFIDFAIGDYNKPDIGIEFSLKNGWSYEEIVYDFIKLMDTDNPFKLGVSYNAILREKEIVSKKRLDELQNRIENTVKKAKKRLNGNIDPNRKLYFLISEISREERRHWLYDQKREVFLLI